MALESAPGGYKVARLSSAAIEGHPRVLSNLLMYAHIGALLGEKDCDFRMRCSQVDALEEQLSGLQARAVYESANTPPHTTTSSILHPSPPNTSLRKRVLPAL